VRHTLDLLLRREGYEVATADSGEMAIARLQDDAAPEVDVARRSMLARSESFVGG
jgi:CheY-like chemotaxis protein